MALLAISLIWGYNWVVMKKVVPYVAPFDFAALRALFGGLALGVLRLGVPGRTLDPAPYFFGALAFNAILATGLAWALWLYVLDHLPAGVAGLSSLGIPAVGVLAGWAQLGEEPSRSELIGMGLIALALGLLYLRSLR